MVSQNRMLRTLRECERQADGEMGVRNMYLRFTNDYTGLQKNIIFLSQVLK
jgi:hypothetical protein